MSEIVNGLLLLAKNNPDLPLAAVLTYAPAINPYAVELAVEDADGAEAMTYTFSRDLLAAGLRTPVGDGDVRIGPVANDDWLIFKLTPEGGGEGDSFEVFAPREQVVTFTARSFRKVPPGREDEWVDWDREVAGLLASTAAHRREVRLWEVHGWRIRTGSLADALDDPAAVIVEALTSYGPTITWRTSRTTLADQAARARDGWVRLEVPGDETLLLQADDVTAFLAARGGVA
ncbi:SsgA family sporulation/cell division regulator [Streptosporangium sp. NPDC051022]|uniref:SsgA family sporulation/cell division regulator n=1 Tax=Streptosporangium sp. NPDC051022 TaxID=3155752 RepID=UPI0034245E78